MEFKVFRVTLKDVIERLEKIEDIHLHELQDAIIDAHDGYNYDGEEELIGFELWEDISQDGEYELFVKIDHEHAYEFTLHTKVIEGKASIIKVL